MLNVPFLYHDGGCVWTRQFHSVYFEALNTLTRLCTDFELHPKAAVTSQVIASLLQHWPGMMRRVSTESVLPETAMHTVDAEALLFVRKSSGKIPEALRISIQRKKWFKND